jgi:cobalt/nickel transport system permease protein/cobalt/nickel transport protein
MPDYALPGQGDSMSAAAMTYILSAVIGVIVCGGLLYFVGKKVAKD